MRIISFAWTSPAIIALVKSVTRRDWDQQYAEHFNEGDILQGWHRQPRYGGKRICEVRLTKKRYLELSSQAPADDCTNEGFAYLTSIGAKCGKSTPRQIWDDWKNNPTPLYVVRFEIVKIF